MKTTFTVTHFTQNLACCENIDIEALMSLPPKKRNAAIRTYLQAFNDITSTAKRLMEVKSGV